MTSEITNGSDGLHGYKIVASHAKEIIYKPIIYIIFALLGAVSVVICFKKN